MAAPIITQVTPPSVPINTTNNITITGSNFDSSCTVWIDNGQCPVVPPITPSQIVATYTSDQYSGPKNVVVFNSDGSSQTLTLQVTSGRGAVATTASAAVASKNIGILSSIGFTGTIFETWFRLGLGQPSSVWPFVPNNPIQESIGYNTGALQNAAQNVLAVNPDVIVTFGGNIVASAMVAKNSGDIPMFSVIGNLTPQLASAAYGGINLDTVARNAERFNRLTKVLNIPASAICFLANPGSAMHYAEYAQWIALNPNGVFYPFSPLTPGSSMTAQQGFDSIFQSFARNGAVSAMLVSADPSFQDFKDELISSANNVNKTVCYPLQTYYNNSGVQPVSGRSTIHGPKLARACFVLGQDVANFLVNGGKAPGFRVPAMHVDAGDDVS
jgi:hypothetical protein